VRKAILVPLALWGLLALPVLLVVMAFPERSGRRARPVLKALQESRGHPVFLGPRAIKDQPVRPDRWVRTDHQEAWVRQALRDRREMRE